MRKKPGPSFWLFLFAESHLPDWDYHYPCLFPTLNTVFFKRTAWNEVGGTPWTAHGPGGDVAVSEELIRLTPELAVELPRALRDDLEDRFQSACANGSNGCGDWQQLLGKRDDTLSNAVQLAPQKGVFAVDLDAELERL